MNDKLVYKVIAVLGGSWFIFAAVAGWRAALWLIPAVIIGILVFRWGNQPPVKPTKYHSNITSRHRHVEYLPPEPPSPPRTRE